MKDYRKRIWIDPFQTRLMLRIVLYCVVYQVIVWAFFALCDMINHRLAPMGVECPWFTNVFVRNIMALLILAPPLTLDVVRFAHRFVGPLYRFRKSIQAIAAGEPVPLVQLRKGDYLMDLRDDFNRMLQHLEQQGLVLVKAPEVSQTTRPAQPVTNEAITTMSLNS